MGVSSRAGKYLTKLAKDKDPGVAAEAGFRAKSVEVSGKSKKELEAMAKSKAADNVDLAKTEMERRASNRAVKKSLASDVESGKISTQKADTKYKNRRELPVSGESARDSAQKAYDRRYTEMDDTEDFAKGGMVTKKKAKAPATPSRSHPLNKFYGK